MYDFSASFVFGPIKIKMMMMMNHRTTHHVLIVMRGMGAQVKKTVIRRKNLRPHTSDSAPISGALRKDSSPCQHTTRSHIPAAKDEK
jgi:hypothetical protein